MRRKSLARRLIVSSAGWSVLVLAIAGFLFSSLFQAAVERTFDARMLVTLDALQANIEYDQNGRLFELEGLGDSRFIIPLQGWYWQVRSADEASTNQLRSNSLLEKSLTFPANALDQPDESGISRFYQTGPEGFRLRVLEQKVQLPGSDEALSFAVAGNSDELEAEIATFDQTLLVALSVLALGLVTAALLQVRFGLRPMRDLTAGLISVRSGKANRLEGEFPVEIEPVAGELNALLKANEEIVERARTQVGNLAHALKTPLSVMSNEAERNSGSFADKVVEQAEVMRDQVNLYLDRARRAARAHALGSLTEIRPVLDGLVRTLKRINADKNVDVTIDCPDVLRFLGEKQDLEEMVGNLLDNAFKWAGGKVDIKVWVVPSPEKAGKQWLILSVADDGPGLPEDKRNQALKRGRRLDETKPGSGLGLSIVEETASMYDGGITLGSSELGGLSVELTLPATQVDTNSARTG